jgi:HK97 family phage portal protein
LARLFAAGADVDGVPVTEKSVMGLSAFYRAVSLIAGQLAGLPLRSFTTDAETGMPRRVSSIYDNPDPEGQTVFEWKETAFAQLILWGRYGALKIRNAAGGLVGLVMVPAASWSYEDPKPSDKSKPVGGMWFRVQLDTGRSVRYDAQDFFHVPGLSLDGRRGVSLLTYARISMATSISGDRAAGNMFANGAMISGLATPADGDDLSDDLPSIRREVSNAVQGVANAGTIAIVNRQLDFTPWSMTAVDAQFLQSRQFQIEEISRWTGVPPHLLMQTDKQTSWGTGVEMQDRALGRTVLAPWAQRFEGRASRLLASPRWCEFDFSGLERPSPEAEIALLVQQINVGLLTLNEARAIRNLPPVAGGDVPRGVSVPAGDSGEGGNDPTAE